MSFRLFYQQNLSCTFTTGLLLLLLLLSTQSVRADNLLVEPVWSNATQEFLNVATAPIQGTWEGYLLSTIFAVGVGAGLNNDLNWYHAIQVNRTEWQDKVMIPATLLGDGLFHVGGYALLYKFGSEYDRRVAAMAIEGQIVTAIVAPLIKASFTATRPEFDKQTRHWFTGDLTNTSFVSGHTITAFCAAAILGDAYGIEWITYPLAALAAYSRIYNQRHWPTDVIAGAGIGLLIGHTVVAFHQTHDNPPGIRFSLLPIHDGGQLTASWDF